MTIWTLDAQPGTGGTILAELLAARSGVALVDARFASALADELGTTLAAAREVERAAGYGLRRHALAIGAAAGVAPAVTSEIRRQKRVTEVVERVIADAARGPAVIVGRGAFAVLADHPGACHASVRAPFDWRAERVARTTLTPIRRARRELSRADRRRRATVRALCGRDPDDPRAYHVVCDASRLAAEAIIDVLLAASGRAVPAASGVSAEAKAWGDYDAAPPKTAAVRR